MTKEEIGLIIKKCRVSAGLTQSFVAEQLNRPQQTIANWEVGRSQPDANTLFLLFQVLGVSLDEAFGIRTKKETAPLYSSEALKLAKDYDDLDGHGKRVVRLVTDEEKARCATPAPVEQPQRHRAVVTLHRPFTQVAAAEGAGAFLLDNNYDEVTVELNSFTQKADIILKVVGRSMEPEIHDGDHILVREQPSVEEGEIGVFIIDGNGFLKQAGPDRLISLNPNIEDVIITSQQTAECYGKYICVLNPDWVVEELTAEGAK